MDRTDQLELRIFGYPFGDAGRDGVIDENPGQSADLQQVATGRHGFGEVFDFALAHGLEVHGNTPGAGLVHDAVEGHDDDAGIAGFFDRTVDRGGRSGVHDDGVIALQYHVLDLSGLLGRLVFSGGKGVRGRDNARSHRLAGDLFPARQHRLTPRIASIVV